MSVLGRWVGNALEHARVEAIYDTLLAIFKLAAAEGIPTSLAADRLAERRLAIGSSGELKSSRMMNAVTS